MTPEQAETLLHFKWSEFKHADLMDFAFCTFLDEVRDAYGFPIVLTNDGRTPAENDALRAQGSAPNSRHLAGQAVDMRLPPTSNHLWRLVEAIVEASHKCSERAIELELAQQHLHLAWLEPGRASKLFVSADK